MVKVLSRDAVQRMTGRRSSTTSTVSGGGDGSGVSMAWVEENYISKNFFNQLFTIHGTHTYVDEETEEEVTEEVVITPNAIADGEEYKLSNVEVSVGLWTQQFLSALGLNPGGGGGSVTLNNVLDGINNTAFPSATPSSAGQAIVWNGTKWTFGTAGGGGGTVTSVGLSVPTGFTVNNSPITSAGTIQLGFTTGYSLPTTAKQSNWDTAYGWGNHADAGYATQQWVQQQGYLTQHQSLAGYATQQWVQQKGYLTSHQSVDGTFWGQSWSNHGTVTGDMTNVGRIFQTGNFTLMNYQGIGLMIEGSAVTGNEYRATFGFHPAGSLAWLDSNTVMQLKTNTVTGESFVHINNGILQIGDARLVYDSTNNALKAVKADGTALNFYATGGVSALGMSAGVSQMNAMTFNHLSIKNSLTLSGSVNIITGTTSYMVRNANDSDCIYLMNTYVQSKINSRQYYYNQYDNVGLHGTNYEYSETWYIDPDGCARFSRVYLNNNTYIHTNGSDLLLTIGSTRYKLTKTTA